LGDEKRKISNPDLIKVLREKLEAREEIVFATVFGSFLECSGFHDVDIGIHVDREVIKDVIDASLYSEELSKDLVGKIGVPVDIVILNFAPMWLIRRALNGILLVDRDPVLRAALRLTAIDNAYVASVRK
jgi:predicted nucleotidyltransferase